MLYNCSLVRTIWLEIQDWCKDKNYNKISIENKFILFGINNTDYLTQTLVKVTKHVIYKSKFNNKIPVLNNILFAWENCKDIEGFIAMCNNTVKTFLGKLSPKYKPLKDL